ncbi:3-oxoacyl-(acyl-carrier-protein) synthase III [Azospirillaceae bacterium]
MKAVIEGIRIAGMRAVTPRQRHSFMEDHSLFSAEEAEKLYASIGVYERRLLPRPYCASDMCLAAAEGLIQQLDWDPASIELLIFISQDADYVLPATACIMQRRLGMPTTSAAFDIPLGCSGFVYGMWTASRLLSGSSAKRALVLCGDVPSRYLVPDDRSTLPLFGDAGTATALEIDPNAPPIPLVVGTDGSGARNIWVKAGGKRDCLIPEATPRSEEEEARLFKDARLYLNGAEVFAFTLKAVPSLLREAIAHAGTSLEQIDMVVLHQANKFMLDHLRKRVGIPPEKFLVDMHHFGNTSSASIPLAICHRLGEKISVGPQKLLLAGFGVGWSWGAMVVTMGPTPAPTLVDLPEGYPTLVP